MDKDLEKKEAEEKLFAEPSEEQLQQEFQEILRKREAYQKQQEKELQEIREEKKRANSKRLYSVAKIAVLVLVVGTCFVTLSMRSEATRMWWLKDKDRAIGEESENVVNNDDNRMISNMDEKEAIANIEEELNIPMPELIYKPEGMVFDSYMCDKNVNHGSLYYLYDGYIVSLETYTFEVDSTYARNYDGDVINKEIVKVDFGEVHLKEMMSNQDHLSSMVAQWKYNNHQYMIEGKMSFEEMRKIVENIFY